MKFNPFKCKFEALGEEELQFLVTDSVAEGWFVEYKEQPSPKKGAIGKSVCAFANSEGGYYFIGIKAGKDANTVIDISGFDLPNGNYADTVSQSIVGNVSPTPEFDLKMIELNNGKYVLVIKVEQGVSPPYILSTGQVILREESSNNPVKDRYVIEKLYERAKGYNSKIERFTETDFQESVGQAKEDVAHVELYMFPSPLDSFQFPLFKEEQFFNSLAKAAFDTSTVKLVDGESPIEMTLGLGLNNILTSHDSYILRPVNCESITRKGLTLELFKNGGVKVLMPLNQFKMNSPPEKYSDSIILEKLLDKYAPSLNGMDSFDSRSSDKRDLNDVLLFVRLLDGEELILVMMYICSFYRSILVNNGLEDGIDIGFRARVNNCWRKVIFFNDDTFLDFVEKYELPCNPKDNVEMPRFVDGNYFKVKLTEMMYAPICRLVMEGVGMSRNDTQFWANQVSSMVGRIIKNQQNE